MTEKKKHSSDHTKYRYDECFAKIVLEEFFPNKYKNLIIKDKPDLVDESNNIGIEVVNAIPTKIHEAESCWMKIQSHDYTEKTIYTAHETTWYTLYGSISIMERIRI